MNTSNLNAIKTSTAEENDCLIVQGDYHNFISHLPAGSVDLMLTDPPYTISRRTGFSQVKNGVKRFAVSMDFGAWDKASVHLETLCHDTIRVLKRGGTAIIWYDLWKLSRLFDAMKQANFKLLRLVIWQKSNPVPLNKKSTYLSNSREIAIVGVKGGKPTFHGDYDNGIYHAPIPRHGGKRLHPTQKPLHLFEDLIKKHSNEGDLVIDPFLGSGTTAVAALQLSRRFSGCDIDATYVATAKRRLHSGKLNELRRG